MLKTRILTALLLLLILLPALLFLPQLQWALLTAGVIALGAWEWGALVRMSENGRKIYAALVFLGLASLALVMPWTLVWPEFAGKASMLGIYGLATAFWLLLVPLWLRVRWSGTGPFGALLGVLVLLPPWLAIVQFRAVSPLVLLAVLSVAWVADIAAYFTGRAFGRHKLAPSVSPGKTWEGVAGALVGVLAFGFMVGPLEGVDSFFWGLVLLVLTGVSVLGDLFESLLKRLTGIKDSSQLLPGHGGILDRIDSLTAILPVAAFFKLLLS